MECKEIEDKLSSYIDNQLSSEERMIVAEHLKECSKCSLVMEELKKTVAHIQTIEETEPPPWLEQKIMSKVREEAEQKQGMLHKLFFPRRLKIPLQAAATIAIAVTAFFTFRAIEPEVEKVTIKREKPVIEEEKAGRFLDSKEKVPEMPQDHPVSQVMKKKKVMPTGDMPYEKTSIREKKEGVTAFEAAKREHQESQSNLEITEKAKFSARAKNMGQDIVKKREAILEEAPASPPAYKRTAILTEDIKSYSLSDEHMITGNYYGLKIPDRELPLDILLKLLEGDDPDKRLKAATALGNKRDPHSIEALTEALKDENEYVRSAASAALDKIRDPHAIELSIEELKSNNPMTRAYSVEKMVIWKDPATVQPLISALGDSSPEVRQLSAKALGGIKDSRAVEPLIEALKDPEPSVRHDTALALGHIGDRRAVTPLIKLLSDEDPQVRGWSAQALGYIKDSRAIEPLSKLLDDENQDVRSKASDALNNIKNSPSDIK